MAPRLTLVFLQLTERCNLECTHCCSRPARRKARPEEIRTGKAFLLVDQIAGMGRPRLVFQGGEPLLREDLFDLLEFARHRGLAPVVETNAALVDGAAARSLARAGIAHALVGLDGADARAHDGFRRQRGAFEKTVAGLACLREAGVPFRIATVLSAGRGAGLRDVAALALRLGAQALLLYADLPAPCAVWEGGIRDRRPPTSAEIEKTLGELASETPLRLEVARAPCLRDGPAAASDRLEIFPCGAGRSLAAIRANGTVLACPDLAVPVGNIHESPFPEIWGKASFLLGLRGGASRGRGDLPEGSLGCPARAPPGPA